jgi:YfiH family protein
LEPHRAYRLKQIHSALVHPTPVEPDASGDALWTGRAGESVWVGSADCTPILLADPVSGTVAAIHAGWRGTAQSILPATIEHLRRAGADPRDLLCAMGPAISGRAYQVSESVAFEVTGTVQRAELALLPDVEPGKVRLDVREVNRQQALQSGLRAERIAVCPACTFGSPDWLHSYRREGGGKIQFSGIGPGLAIEHRPGDDHGLHRPASGFAQGGSTARQRRAGGTDIVDQQDRSAGSD